MLPDEAVEYVDSLDLKEGSEAQSVISRLILLGPTIFLRAITSLQQGQATYADYSALPDINVASVGVLLAAIDGGVSSRAKVIKEALTTAFDAPESSMRLERFAPFIEFISKRMLGREAFVALRTIAHSSSLDAEIAVRNELLADISQEEIDDLAALLPPTPLPVASHTEIITALREPIFLQRPYASYSTLEPTSVVGTALRGLHAERMAPPSLYAAVLSEVATREATDRPSGAGLGQQALADISAGLVISAADFFVSYHKFFIIRVHLPEFYERSLLGSPMLPAARGSLDASLAYMEMATGLLQRAVSATRRAA